MKDAACELPIRLGDVLQVGLVVRDLQKSMETYWRVLGIGPWKIYTYAPPMLREATVRGRRADYSMRVAHAQAGPTQLELIQPLDGPSIYQEHLATKGEGLHHIQSRIENHIERGACRLRGARDRRPHGREVRRGGVLLPRHRADLGVIYEIFQRKSRPAPDAVYPPDAVTA